MGKVNSIKNLKLIANAVRHDIIRMLTEAGSGHPGGSLGMADIFTALYFNVAKHRPDNPSWEGRDIIVLSNGHICPVLYAVLARSGYFPIKEIMTLRKNNTRLQGHPHRESLPGLETTSGPLGSGISQSAGMAYALKLDRKPNLVFCFTSDGEHDEGNTWEGVMLAAKYKLNNLIAIMDRNHIQIDGYTDKIMPLGDLAKKYKAFNWNVITIEGHNMKQVLSTLKKARRNKGKPLMIIANTVPGKGVSFMEHDPEWHGKAPSKEQEAQALEELSIWRRKIESGKA